MKIKNLMLWLMVMLPMLIGVATEAWADDGSHDCQETVTAFLATPNKITHSSLLVPRAIDCWTVIKSSNANLDKLNYSVGKGNVWSAQYLAQHLNDLDGGNLEDSLIAMGNFSDHEMSQLLVFSHDGLLSKAEFRDALTMLPLVLSDDPHAQLSLLKSRKNKILRVTQKKLLEQRESGVKAIDDFMLEIRLKNPSANQGVHR